MSSVIKTEIVEVPRPSAPNKRFDKVQATNEVKSIVDRKLKGKLYDSEEASKMSKELADEIRAKVRIISDNRFKICSSVTIISQKGQGIRMSNKCYFDTESDSEVTYVYTSDDLVCVATLYAIYFY